MLRCFTYICRDCPCQIRLHNVVFLLTAVGADYGQPCSDIYPGESPFSEPEARNLAIYMYSIRRRIKAYVDFHSYGQLWMSPWGFTTRYFPPTYAKHVRTIVLFLVVCLSVCLPACLSVINQIKGIVEQSWWGFP